MECQRLFCCNNFTDSDFQDMAFSLPKCGHQPFIPAEEVIFDHLMMFGGGGQDGEMFKEIICSSGLTALPSRIQTVFILTETVYEDIALLWLQGACIPRRPLPADFKSVLSLVVKV